MACEMLRLLCLINHNTLLVPLTTVIQLPWQRRRGAHPCAPFLKQTWRAPPPKTVNIELQKTLEETFLKVNSEKQKQTQMNASPRLRALSAVGESMHRANAPGFDPRKQVSWLFHLFFDLEQFISPNLRFFICLVGGEKKQKI